MYCCFEVGLPASDFFIFRSIGIIGLGKNFRQIFGFKAVTRKIFRNKDLGQLGVFSVQMTKGAGRFRTLFLLYNSIISIPPCHPANFPDIIFLANSLAYAENRRKRGLTRFPQRARKGMPETLREGRGRRALGHLRDPSESTCAARLRVAGLLGARLLRAHEPPLRPRVCSAPRMSPPRPGQSRRR